MVRYYGPRQAYRRPRPVATRRARLEQTARRRHRQADAARAGPMVPRPLGGFPLLQTVRLRYCQEINIDALNGAATGRDFAANGMFDPDAALGGHQPLGFDQWIGLYAHYNVKASKMRVEWRPTGTANANPGYFGIYLSPGTGSIANYTSIEHLLESRMSRSAVGRAGLISGGRTPYAVEKGWSWSKTFGTDYMTNQNRGNNGINPPEASYYTFWFASTGNNNPTAQNFLITIDYICTFSEYKVMTAS